MTDTPEVKNDCNDESDVRRWDSSSEHQISVSNEAAKPTVQQPMTTHQKLIVVSFCMSSFGAGVFYSLLGPFFPIEAAKKGLSSMLVGFVFGLYELVFVLTGPIFGIYLTQIGPKFMFLAGLMSCGYCAIIFGFLDFSPPGGTYAALCFIVRSVEGLGAAAMLTSSYAIIAFSFPDRVSTMFGTLEVFAALGMMVGPPIGGWLYQIGGFRLPFLSSGSVLIALGMVTFFILPSPENPERPQMMGPALLQMLSTPIVLIVCWLMMCASGCIGFLDVGLAPVLSGQLGLSPLLTGFTFLVTPGVYALTSPIWGILADTFPKHSIWLIICGYIVGGLAFWLLGPAPFLGLELKLWSVIVANLFIGLGIGTMVAGLQLFTIAAQQIGLPESLGTKGVISGIFTSSSSFGVFLGPVASGAMLDNIGFAWTATVIGCVTAGSAVLTMVYVICTRLCRGTHPGAEGTDKERAPLVSSHS